ASGQPGSWYSSNASWPASKMIAPVDPAKPPPGPLWSAPPPPPCPGGCVCTSDPQPEKTKPKTQQGTERPTRSKGALRMELWYSPAAKGKGRRQPFSAPSLPRDADRLDDRRVLRPVADRLDRGDFVHDVDGAALAEDRVAVVEVVGRVVGDEKLRAV